ncbi:uncharacterized protein LOC141720265 [Apium graveolens]|uniref:uncharacterized protein LOC141720265 n=1 Tax=Apium graveolens TaxID=4045 RepID=UPI003D7B17F3
MLFEVISKYVEMIGPKNIVQVVMDSASNNKVVGRMLMIRYPHLFWTPCGAHYINLILEDISSIQRLNKCIKKAMHLNSFIYKKPTMVNLLREHTSQMELLRPTKTQFATSFLTLSRINKQKINIRNMFLSEKWLKSNYAKDLVGRKIVCFVNQARIWNTVFCSLKVSGPLVKVLRLVDDEKRPSMGYIMKLWIGPKKRLRAAYYLNPDYYYKNPNIKNDGELSLGLYKHIERMLDVDVQDKIGDQLELYKRAEGFFGLLMLHSKKRNRLAQQKLNDLVFVKYNRASRRRYELRDKIDPILLNEIDDNNEWLVGKVDGESDEENDDYVFSKEDGLTYRDVAKASGTAEPRDNSR